MQVNKLFETQASLTELQPCSALGSTLTTKLATEEKDAAS